MFHPITIPFGCVMLFNVVDLKEGVSVSDVELVLGEMCNVVKNTYGDDNGGFISDEGTVMDDRPDKRIQQNMGDIVIVTYWQSLDQHEKSHADKLFKDKFSELADFCDATFEVGYEMLWQGVPED